MFINPVGTCDDCGKLRFKSRKQAKVYMHNRFPKERMSVYRCGGYFHFGHTPYGVARGYQERNRA